MKNKEKLIAWMQANEGCSVHPDTGSMAFNMGDGSWEFTFDGILCGASGLGRFTGLESEEPEFVMYDGTPTDLYYAPDSVYDMFGITIREAEEITRSMKLAQVQDMKEAIKWIKENL